MWVFFYLKCLLPQWINMLTDWFLLITLFLWLITIHHDQVLLSRTYIPIMWSLYSCEVSSAHSCDTDRPMCHQLSGTYLLWLTVASCNCLTLKGHMEYGQRPPPNLNPSVPSLSTTGVFLLELSGWEYRETCPPSIKRQKQAYSLADSTQERAHHRQDTRRFNTSWVYLRTQEDSYINPYRRHLKRYEAEAS